KRGEICEFKQIKRRLKPHQPSETMHQPPEWPSQRPKSHDNSVIGSTEPSNRSQPVAFCFI
ncbi:hypothetical protein N7508_006379, partial [Penicillium antarcticum]|uniref:uncharacterized protein n=1 Tax=Penicillium antarcticum TaxID=416450 RepID=UPI002394F298